MKRIQLSGTNYIASLSKCCEMEQQGHCYMLPKNRKWLQISESCLSSVQQGHTFKVELNSFSRGAGNQLSECMPLIV